MIVLGVDFETTSLEPATGRITEIGAVLWDTLENKPLKIYNELVACGAPIPDEITKITGITDKMIAEHGVPQDEAFIALGFLMMEAEYVLAHNAPFDRAFYEETCKRLGHEVVLNKWIDTSVDVPYDEKISTRKLIHLAAEHGFLNPFAHRAVFDVLTMLAVCAKYDWQDIKRLSHEPNVKLIAQVSYDDREKAKARGYRWDAPAKQWVKTVKQSVVEREAREAPFKFYMVELGSNSANASNIA